MSDQNSSTKITPYLCTSNTAQAIEFYKEAFGAVEIYRINDGDKISHAEIQIDGVPFMVSDEYEEINVLSPQTIGNSPVMLVLEVPDVDTTFNQAVTAGAIVDRPLMDTFNGELRNGKLVDPFGHRWMLLTRKAVAQAE